MSSLGNWQTNALWPGEAIAARLRAVVPALREVLVIDQFDPGTTAPRQLPAAVVLLDSLRVTGSNAVRRQTATDQDWMVALAVRTAGRDPNADSSELGALIPAVVAALQGWLPQGCSRGFAWATGPRPNYGADVSYFPLIFTIPVVAGQPDPA